MSSSLFDSPSHVSPVFAPAMPWRSLRDHSRLRLWRPRHLAELSRRKSAGQAHSARGRAVFGYLAKFLPPTGYEPKEFDKITSVGNDTTLINDPDHSTSVSVAESMLMKSRRNSIRSHSIQTHKEFYSDERDFREHLEMKSSTSCSWWKFSFPKFGTKKFRMRVIRVATRAWISKTTICGRYSLDRSSSTWKNLFV